MSGKQSEFLPGDLAVGDLEARCRREFLLSLGKWSKVVIGGVLLRGVLMPVDDAMAWVNHGGGAGIWYNSGGGWGGWVNQPWRWYNGPHWHGRPHWRRRRHWHDWYNRPWYNRPWYNGGWYEGWYNR